MAPDPQNVADGTTDRIELTGGLLEGLAIGDSTQAAVTACSTPRDLLYELLHQLDHRFSSQLDFDEKLRARAQDEYAEITNAALQGYLAAYSWLQELKTDHPYSLLLYLAESDVLATLCYPDLAAASAYKALLLLDAVSDESDEYHEAASASLTASLGAEHYSSSSFDEQVVTLRYRVLVNLSVALLQCGCLRSAWQYCQQGLDIKPNDVKICKICDLITAAVLEVQSEPLDASEWPDEGLVRREVYPWNDHEPDRAQELDKINQMLNEVAPKLEVKAVSLPNLVNPADPDVIQLGVFAKEDLAPGDIVLNETSLLTANNRLQDALCDACNADLPGISDSPVSEVVGCQDCEVVFCSQECHDLAQEKYHPALCDRDVEAIAKDSTPEQAADSLYSLLLLRTLAMAETQGCHPLDLAEVKYIWGDFNSVESSKIFTSAQDTPSYEAFPRTLPFSFEYNVRLPYHMLEKMDIDIFASSQHDIWVFNTLYAKFRGTASARLSGLGGRAIRGPEVCAVHPMWCLANHSCDPNVSWQWGGSIAFHVRNQRVEWQGRNGKIITNKPGIRKGEEVLNHYCDLDLPVQERRAWARGALGGDCMCQRCIWEDDQVRA